MNRYFFPCLLVTPVAEEKSISSGRVTVHRRLWDTSTFDLATLATKHRLHLPYQIMDVLLQSCNLEIELRTDGGFEDAREEIEVLRALLYLEGVMPFIVPFAATHSVNEYSGINSRDSALLRDKLPEGLRRGITSAEATVEAWPVDLVIQLVTGGLGTEFKKEQWLNAADKIDLWISVEKDFPIVDVARRILTSAPMISDMRTSVLHLWQGIEAMFPAVNAELSFRIALLTSQLCSTVTPVRDTYEEAKAGYRIRSKITHGASPRVGSSEWRSAWFLLCRCLRSVGMRRKLPSEEELMLELIPGDAASSAADGSS